MKKILCFFTAFFFTSAVFLFANDDKDSLQEKSVFNFEESSYAKEKWANVPQAKRPKTRSQDELVSGGLKDEKSMTDDYVKKCQDTFLYGLETEITDLIDELNKAEDLRFVDEIYDLFEETNNSVLKQKIIEYFTKLKDPCLEDFAVEVINDPYDQKKDTVSDCFKYIAAVDCKAAIPGLVELVDKEEEDYFNGALTCLGEIGGEKEALFLADYLDREDLSVAQKQALMRVLGKIKSVQTWEKLSEIAQDENENTFVRMYAAEAIGAMQKSESEDILIDLFEDSDPNLRSYVIKGISYYTDTKADRLIISGIRDSQYKVRLEAINAASERDLKDAVPYLIYRCKDKSEQDQVKNKCYESLAKLNTSEGNEYLLSLITDKKVSDRIKIKVSAALLKENNTGSTEIIKLAKESLLSDQKKSLRYALGKEFAKYGRPEYEEICGMYIDHADVSTQGTGLDIFAKGKYDSLRVKVYALARDAEIVEEEKTETSADKKANTLKSSKKPNANAKKAKAILERTGFYSKEDRTLYEEELKKSKSPADEKLPARTSAPEK